MSKLEQVVPQLKSCKILNIYVAESVDQLNERFVFNHSKLLVSDDALCTVGSTNIDFRSFENNFEANAFIYDEQMACRLKDVYLQDVKESVLLEDVRDLGNQTFIQRLWESLVRLISPLL